MDGRTVIFRRNKVQQFLDKDATRKDSWGGYRNNLSLILELFRYTFIFVPFTRFEFQVALLIQNDGTRLFTF